MYEWDRTESYELSTNMVPVHQHIQMTMSVLNMQLKKNFKYLKYSLDLNTFLQSCTTSNWMPLLRKTLKIM